MMTTITTSKLIDQPIKSVYIYSRVSTPKQAECHKHSISYQKTICTNYAKKYYKKSSIEYFSDIGSSYQNKNILCGLNRMIKKMVPSSLILVGDISRIGRNVHQVMNILKLVEKKNSYIVSIIDGICYNKTRLMNKQFLHKVVDSEKESDILSFRVRNTQMCIKNLGGYIGKPPYGYKVNRNEYNIPMLQDNIEELAIVEKMYSLIGDSISYNEIAIKFNEESIDNRGNEWTSASVKRILNKFYPDHMAICINTTNIGKIKICDDSEMNIN